MKNPDDLTSMFFSRELSWLDFNKRVLDEAADERNMLLERLKFIAIFSSNLDEFFMVRVAGLNRMVSDGCTEADVADLTPAQQLEAIRKKLEKLLRAQAKTLTEILRSLESHQIRIHQYRELPQDQRRTLQRYFREYILPVLTPLALDEAHPFPIVNNGAIELAVSLRNPNDTILRHAFVELPEFLPRFLRTGSCATSFVLLEDLVSMQLEELFPGCEIIDCFPFRVTRDMDLTIGEEADSDLLPLIEKQLIQRRQRNPIRLELGAEAAGNLEHWLKEAFKLPAQFCYRSEAPLHLKQFFELAGKSSDHAPELLEENWTPVMPSEFAEEGSVFPIIASRPGILLMLPFHSFSPVLRFLEEAADDPNVLAIKQTLYRVSGNSPVVSALRRAAMNGKQVTVVVELKARFDESNNIQWARKLEEAGAHVIYGISGLKVHCKALLVVRREDGMIRRYAHLGTGNYNDKTAMIYTDCGLFTCDEDICFDVANLFNVMTGCSAAPPTWRKIACSPFDMRSRILALIERERQMSTPQSPGKIIAKMNSLVDPEVIRALHQAAGDGVEIDLIVRGICCLNPGATGRIHVRSIVDRFLEHTRLFYFHNGGMEEYYLSSADWMTRNLDRRIELLFPVEDPALRGHLMKLLQFQLSDNVKARELNTVGVYRYAPASEKQTCRSQQKSYHYIQSLAPDAPPPVQPGEVLTVFSSLKESNHA